MTRNSRKNARDHPTPPPAAAQGANVPVAGAPKAPGTSARPLGELLHAAQVRQIELEVQNAALIEALRDAQLALEVSLERFVDFYEFAPVGFLSLTERGLIADINLTGAGLLGLERTELLQKDFSHCVIPEDTDRWRAYWFSVMAQEETKGCELLLRRADGASFDARLDCLRLLKSGFPVAVRIVLTDITERKQAEKDVLAREEFFRMIAENVEDFVAVLDLEGRRVYNSNSYVRFFGDVASLKGTDSFAEIHPEDAPRVEQAFAETVRSGRSHRLNFRFVLPDGSIRCMESCGALIRNSHGQPLHVVVVSRDITERIENEEKIRNLAFYDPLTQLPNRRLLDDRIDQAMAGSMRSGQYCALMLLDLDNFKALNDLHGHVVGDLLLIEVAQRATSCVREMDTVARFGGDEFVVVLSALDMDEDESTVQSSVVAEKIRASLAEPYQLKFQRKGAAEMSIEHHCTASIGVTLFFKREASMEDILKRADKAMYQAKEEGHNLVRFVASDG